MDFDSFSFGWLYPAALALWAAACVAGAAFALKLEPARSEKLSMLPRASIPGAILALVDLLWCVPNAKPIVPESLHVLLIPAAFALAILAWIFLDKLLARAFGGFLILLAHYFLKESFSDALPGSILFAILCFVVGTFGIFVSGKPHLLRDLLRKLCADKNWRVAGAAFLGAFAVSSFSMFAFHLLASGRTA